MKRTITFMLLLLMAGAAMSQGSFTCGEQISDVEGNTYETVEIGGLCWTKENMKSKTYSDGTPIAKAMIYSSSMCPDTNANLATYGRLYTWFSAVNVPEGSSSKPTRNADGFVQGICPDGWHIPTVGEMNKLNANSSESLRSVELWLQPNNNTNSTGFSSLPAGYYSNTTNRFEVLLGYTYYWSDSSSTPEFAIACDVNYFCDVAKNEQKTTGDGVSVRCVKDYSLSASTFTCGTDKVTDVEGHDYNTVLIGDQCWMKENLRVTKYADGTEITAGEGNKSTTEPFYYDYTYSGIDLKDRGYLYNWPAANLVCPDGWHLPSDAEWNLMEKTVSGSDWQDSYETSYNFRGTHAGKLAGGDKWNSMSSGNVPGNTNYTERNASGFSAVPAGDCGGSSFGGAGSGAFFWSSTQYDSDHAWYRVFYFDAASVGRFYYGKDYGHSVRCVKDYSPSANTFTCGTDKVTDVDGNDYNTVKIGDQCWMRENLRTTKYADGTAINAGGSSTSDTDPYYYDYTESGIDLKDRGYLYNWSAANLVCPDGWHLPSDAEWNTMEKFVSGSDWQDSYETSINWRGSHAGKLAGGDKWSSVSSGNLPGNMDYTERNASGFSAVPAGGCVGSTFSRAGVFAYFWSSTHNVNNFAWSRILDYDNASVYRNYSYKNFGYSVRCVKDKERTLPTVTTAAVTSVTAITATCGGEVTTDGGAPVTACGVCWSISPNPTINDSLTTNGSDIGRFTSSLTRLIPGTTYYVRAYATNSEGTEYGNEVSFTAQNGPCPLQTTVSDNDGHTYNTVLIGNQCWMKENLRTTKYPNGSDISTEDYHNYNTSSLTLEQRGLLYNWTTVMNGANSSEANPSGVQGICPTGWHVPSAAEWKQLRDYVLSQNEYTCSNTGGYAKALASPIGWNPSESPCAVGNTPGNNNATGFSALPVGFWSVSVLYGGAYNETNFWSSTEGSLSSLAFAPEIVADGDRMSVDQDQFRKTSAFSVRCIRDVVIDENSCAEAETVTDKEGNVYATVKIGNQCWMRENLRTKKYKDGTDIAAGENNTSVTEGYYYDVTSTGIALTQRGYHYNWPAANLICPNGWHLPSDAEWNTMEQTLSGSDWQDDYTTSTGFRGSHAGKLALAGGNESGFSAVPARACVGLFSSTSLGYDAYFWSSTPGNSEGACSRALDHNKAGVERSYYGKFNGFSVRCVKD